jgi:hypothetical protein
MNRITTFLFFVFFLGSLTLHAQTKEWTLLVYMVGSDIVDDGIADMGEMMAAGNTDNVNIVGLFGGSKKSGWETPTSSIFVNGQEFGQTFVPTLPNMANPQGITEFLNWGISNYPAQKYMLVFYNHGMDIRGFGYDEVADKSNSIPEIEEGIKNSDFIQGNNKFELLGFDACLMASFEVQSALRDVANYYVASEETEPYHAWNWTPVIQAMNSQTGIKGDELGKIIIDKYLEQSRDFETQNVTLSLIQMDKITALETSVESLFDRLDDDIYLRNLIKARSKSEEYHKVIKNPEFSDDMVDLGDLVKNLLDLEPGLETEINEVLSRLDDAVIYEKSDSTRPKANGISLYMPLNVLVEEGEAYWVVDENYKKINFSNKIKSFVSDNYLEFALADRTPMNGNIDPNFGFRGTNNPNGLVLSNNYSAIKVSDHDDLDQIQVVLIEEFQDIPNEYILLGSAYPDTAVVNPDETVTYGYLWDGYWLGLNGYPAYISDIQYHEVEDENGNFDYGFTRLQMPAVLNLNTADEKDIIITFTFDDDFNYELESILREPYGPSRLPSKERIQLKPNDEIQLLYEVFDDETNDSYFVINNNQIIEIENGNEDLYLEYDQLPEGRYHLGFVLMDHSQNDTVIYDPKVHIVENTRTVDNGILEYQINVIPNPATDFFTANLGGFKADLIQVFDVNGKKLYERKINGENQVKINSSGFSKGLLIVKIYAENTLVTKKVIIE